MAERGRRCPGEKTEGDAERERRAQVAFRPRKARRFHPAHLVLESGDEPGIDDHVVDDVVAEHDGRAELERLVAEDEIVGAVFGRNAKAAHAANDVAPECHRRAEYELHALDGARGQHAGAHLHAHADGLEARP